GSITFIGAVSPAGGNLKEPVTESTKKAARCFYSLSQERADSKRYPAVDPIDSYSKYLEYEEIQDYLNQNISAGWVDKVYKAKDILLRGKESKDQINILGDDGVPLDYHSRFWKSELIDRVILVQDSFDPVDKSSSMKRQAYMLNLLLKICNTEFDFESYEELQPFYSRVINVLVQMNYQSFESDKFKEYEAQLESILTERRV
ncbi:MAG: V-type ATP synthase subunit A, partial [Candidatus Cloacimonetes bacterium]|nr:V-type ATP synthase subunit A [Candidatus Cloacimonadota bacterium]